MLELKQNTHYKLGDWWLAVFSLFMRIFANAWWQRWRARFYVVSIFTGTIYCPVAKEPSEQVIRHESRHLDQAQRDGKILFALRYVLSRWWRLYYEVDAYRHDGRSKEDTIKILSSGAYILPGMDVRKEVNELWLNR